MKQSIVRCEGSLKRTVKLGTQSYETEISDIAEQDLSPDSAWWQSVLRGSRVRLPADAKPLRVVDAFCGSGGLALGLKFAAESIGRKVLFPAIIDTDQAGLDIHSHNLGGSCAISESVAALVDYHVRGSNGHSQFGYQPEVISPALAQVGRVDVFIAGPPCQGHSNLNNHTRREDPRNELYVTAVALGVALDAEVILIENVPTVQNARSDVVNVAIALLQSAGYRVDTAVLKADELGAAQRRSRFFMIAVRGDRLEAGSLKEAAIALARPASPVSWAIGDLLDREPTNLMNSSPALTQTNADRIDYLFDHDLNDLPDAERPDCHKNGTSYTSVYGRMYWDRPAQTITTGFGTPGQGRYIHPLRRRLITPHEAARIQGYPDWFEFLPASVPAKRRNLAKWIGDAVHPILGYVTALAAFEALSDASSKRTDRPDNKPSTPLPAEGSRVRISA